MELKQYQRLTNEAAGRQKMLASKLDSMDSKIAKYKIDIVSIEKAQAFIQKIAKETQEQLRYQLCDIVQLALDTCFPNQYEFAINFEIKRGKTEAALLFKKSGNEIDPIKSSGGGVVDLTAFALRIAVWSLGHSDNVIILDEPFKWLQPKELQLKGIQLIKQLSNRLGIQFIIISNSVNSYNLEEISDKIFKIVVEKGISKIEQEAKDA